MNAPAKYAPGGGEGWGGQTLGQVAKQPSLAPNLMFVEESRNMGKLTPCSEILPICGGNMNHSWEWENESYQENEKRYKTADCRKAYKKGKHASDNHAVRL